MPVEYSCSADRKDAWNWSTSSRLRFANRSWTSASESTVSVMIRTVKMCSVEE